METPDCWSYSVLEKSVLILPMRNGNNSKDFATDANLDGSYPTYEEWKQ